MRAVFWEATDGAGTDSDEFLHEWKHATQQPQQQQQQASDAGRQPSATSTSSGAAAGAAGAAAGGAGATGSGAAAVGEYVSCRGNDVWLPTRFLLATLSRPQYAELLRFLVSSSPAQLQHNLSASVLPTAAAATEADAESMAGVPLCTRGNVGNFAARAYSAPLAGLAVGGAVPFVPPPPTPTTGASGSQGELHVMQQTLWPGTGGGSAPAADEVDGSEYFYSPTHIPTQKPAQQPHTPGMSAQQQQQQQLAQSANGDPHSSSSSSGESVTSVTSALSLESCSASVSSASPASLTGRQIAITFPLSFTTPVILAASEAAALNNMPGAGGIPPAPGISAASSTGAQSANSPASTGPDDNNNGNGNQAGTGGDGGNSSKDKNNSGSSSSRSNRQANKGWNGNARNGASSTEARMATKLPDVLQRRTKEAVARDVVSAAYDILTLLDEQGESPVHCSRLLAELDVVFNGDASRFYNDTKLRAELYRAGGFYVSSRRNVVGLWRAVT